ncbi:hypothetical protein Anas_00617 [Armadillidium nasatum]|uniref:ADAMTS/ADAMTS-like Spacer 1 domain-containing protein n=1 Tax=Armadillidium nasatum TaxID=96803 RepID=A0A5N5TEL8_9CRUS|nr:hypothetical protein Anas_00617 [Armadillidium nasatum]
MQSFMFEHRHERGLRWERKCHGWDAMFLQQPTPNLCSDYMEVANIPKGAYRISIKEGIPTSHFLSLRDHSLNLVLNPKHKETSSHEFVCAGTLFQYVNDRLKEYLFAPGPLLAPVSIMVHGGNSRRERSVLRYRL